MSSIPPTIAAEMALARQNVAMSVIKQSNDQQQAIAQMLEDSSRSAPVSETRGSSVNFSV